MTVENAQQAEQLVERSVLAGSKHDFVIRPELTSEHVFGWVVYYATRDYLRTRAPSASVPGTGPVIVTREGEIVKVSTSMPPSVAIARYEAAWVKARDADRGGAAPPPPVDPFARP